MNGATMHKDGSGPLQTDLRRFDLRRLMALVTKESYGLVCAPARQSGAVHPVGGRHRSDDFRGQHDAAAGHPGGVRHRRAGGADVRLCDACGKHARRPAMAGPGHSADPLPHHRRRQLSQGHAAR